MPSISVLNTGENGSAPVDEVSEACGYGDASFFRRLFKRLTGLTPGQYRRMFAGAPPGMRASAEGRAGNTLRQSK